MEESEPTIEELMVGGVELCVCKSCMIIFRPEENIDNMIDTAPCPECGKFCERIMMYCGDDGPEKTKTNLLKSVRSKLHV